MFLIKKESNLLWQKCIASALISEAFHGKFISRIIKHIAFLNKTTAIKTLDISKCTLQIFVFIKKNVSFFRVSCVTVVFSYVFSFRLSSDVQKQTEEIRNICISWISFSLSRTSVLSVHLRSCWR